jgi:bifunctional enzyme CysN/CysC
MTTRPTLRVVLVGHVDHGKSTLVGRLLHETGSLSKGVAEQVEATSRRRGREMEWAFVTDALQVERDLGVTVDVSYIRLSTPRRPYLLIDAPGHHEFLKNMVSGAAQGDAAVLVVDAAEGVRDQSRRHGFLLHLLGLTQVAVVINKMDLVDYAQRRFEEVRDTLCAHLNSIGVRPTVVVPISARAGENTSARSPHMPWYQGPTLLEALDSFESKTAGAGLPLRLPVQDFYRLDDRRIVVGRIETGQLMVGDEIMLSPSNKRTRIKSIESWPDDKAGKRTASAGMAVGVTFADELFVERGETMSHVANAPHETPTFRGRIFWLSNNPLVQGRRLKLRIGTTETTIDVEKIERVINGADMSRRAELVAHPGDVADCLLRSRRILAMDAHANNRTTGRFVLEENGVIVAGGIVDLADFPDQRPTVTPASANITVVQHRVDATARASRNGHRGGVVWLTGLSGAGKSTLAMAVEQALFQRGLQAFVLDGDNLRHGLSVDLGFSAKDRQENIRRVGEVAALFAEAGFIVITAFISPFRADRDLARTAAERQDDSAGFHEVFLRCNLEVCERRDPKGLYRRARSGQIQEFTGVSAPYEDPLAPELIINTASRSVRDCVDELLLYIERCFRA